MTIFRSRGFDSIIGKDLVISALYINIPPQSTLLVEGHVTVGLVNGVMTEGPKPATKTTLRIAGFIRSDTIDVHNVVISGEVHCKEIRVLGTLAVKRGAKLNADNIHYRELIVETGAMLNGKMFHLDHVTNEPEL